ncbi:MAG: hypothetical protein EXQ47_10580 [Bryobacterales bacterium]|nr:hypothetical protein [Bryobacterales bacterium]
MITPCKLCEKRRARRHCPASGGEICPQCCGAERENTIACPSTCEFLKEARFHEQPPPLAEDQIPNRDVRVTEQFLRDREPLVFTLALALKRALEDVDGVDYDAREALAGEIRKYRALNAGLVVESRLPNTYAAAIQQKLDEAIAELRKAEAAHRSAETEHGLHQPVGDLKLRDADMLGVLVFLQRLEMQYNNGRRRGKAFRDFLTGYLPEATPSVAGLEQ